jgi:putative DNA primase/helicase
VRPERLPQVEKAVELVAEESQFHSVRNYLNALPAWDGVDWVGLLFVTGFGAEDSLYTREVGRMFLLSAIARVLRPGCKADSGPLLIGATGVGKSWSMRILFGEPWVDDLDLVTYRTRTPA